jgi:hypothetical protein
MKRMIGVVTLLGVSSIFAQEPPRAATVLGEKYVTKAITLKYGNFDVHVLDGMGLTIKTSGNIAVITGPQERVDTADAILKQLDVPPPPPVPLGVRKDIQLTAYMIIASPAVVEGTPVPKDLDSALSQVSSVFPYKSFNLFDAVVLRMVEGEGRFANRGHVSGALPYILKTFASGGSYDLSLASIGLTSAPPANLLRLNSFSLKLFINAGLDREGKEKTQTVNVDTNIDMKEGQKIVVGKANIDGSENALIVILTAKVMD